MAHKDSIHFQDSLRYYTLKNTRIVYGGGGIMPDYFVSIDTSYYSDYYRNLVRKGIINRFVLEYVDANRIDLQKKYPDFNRFREDFDMDDGLMAKFFQYAADKGVQKDDQDLILSAGQLQLLLKSYIARDLWSNNEFFRITNDNDPKFETAITILKNWDKFETMLLNSK